MLTCEPVCWLEFQSTLSVRRATHPHQRRGNRLHISIHALRKESDIIDARLRKLRVISIHALRKESDGALLGVLARVRDFNPRSP